MIDHSSHQRWRQQRLSLFIAAVLLLALPSSAAAKCRQRSPVKRARCQLRDPNVRERLRACRALRKQPKHALGAAGALRRGLGDGDARVRRCALEVLAGLGAAVVPKLVQAVGHGSRRSRRGVATALRRIGAAALPAVPGLLRLVRYRDPAVRVAAMWAVGRILCGDRAAVPGGSACPGRQRAPAGTAKALTTALSDMSPKVRAQAAWAAGQAALGAPKLVRALGGLLIYDVDPTSRNAAARALGHIGPPAALAQRQLVAALEDRGNYFVRVNAAEALGRIGPEARKAVPSILAAVRRSARGLRGDPLKATAALAIARIGVRAIPALSRALNDHKTGVRLVVVWALAKLAARSKRARRLLARARRDRHRTVSYAARSALPDIAHNRASRPLPKRLPDR